MRCLDTADDRVECLESRFRAVNIPMCHPGSHKSTRVRKFWRRAGYSESQQCSDPPGQHLQPATAAELASAFSVICRQSKGLDFHLDGDTSKPQDSLVNIMAWKKQAKLTNTCVLNKVWWASRCVSYFPCFGEHATKLLLVIPDWPLWCAELSDKAPDGHIFWIIDI